MQKVIIIGASSGIGRELAKIFATEGYTVGVTARRLEKLQALADEIGTSVFFRKMDVKDTEGSIQSLNELVVEMGGADLVILCAGIGHLNPDLDWRLEEDTIETNVFGFTAMADTAMTFFLKQGTGHLVGISSISAVRGDSTGPAYSASKAFVSNYLEGLAKKAYKENPAIKVTDVQLGLVDTAMAKGEGLFWVAPVEKAAKQIFKAIRAEKSKVYVTKRWALIALLLKLMPRFLYNRI